MLKFLNSKKNQKINEYLIGDYKISIPPNYALPGFQENFKLYDRFLPILVKHFKSNGCIIDIGANIGDTAIAMVQNCSNQIVCIEPSEIFYPYLESNLSMLSMEHRKKIQTIKKFIGSGNISGVLQHSEVGTASIKISERESSIKYFKLDDIIKEHENIQLIKVDTDGFDFDVIQSAENILNKSQPILFWENEIFEEFQLIGFQNLYEKLENFGYEYIYIFDNYGNIIVEKTEYKTLIDLNNYLFSMRNNGCTRTFYYTDILAGTQKNHQIIEEAIRYYKNNLING